MTLCLLAQDVAVTRLQSHIVPVNNFIQELIAPASHDEVLHSKPIMARTPDEVNKTLEETFCQSRIYFNHFIKLRNRQVVSQKFLWHLIACGATGICADYQYSIDIIVPFLYWDQILKRENVSAFLYQGKNNAKFKADPVKYLFDMMNSYQTQFFDQDEPSLVPIIHMVFALASPTLCVAA